MCWPAVSRWVPRRPPPHRLVRKPAASRPRCEKHGRLVALLGTALQRDLAMCFTHCLCRGRRAGGRWRTGPTSIRKSSRRTRRAAGRATSGCSGSGSGGGCICPAGAVCSRLVRGSWLQLRPTCLLARAASLPAAHAGALSADGFLAHPALACSGSGRGGLWRAVAAASSPSGPTTSLSTLPSWCAWCS